jgi:hypothetical protein
MQEVLNCLALNRAKLKISLDTLEKSKMDNRKVIDHLVLSIKEYDQAINILENYSGAKPERNETASFKK